MNRERCNCIMVLVCRVGRRPVVEALHTTKGSHLPSMQGLVGGLVECISLCDGLDLWCCESPGEDWPLNRVIPAVAPELPPGYDFVIDMDEGLAAPGQPGEWRIRGNFFLARHDGRGGLASVTEEDVVLWSIAFSEEDPEAADLMDRLLGDTHR